MNEKDRIKSIEAISKLIKLTQGDLVKWSIVNPADVSLYSYGVVFQINYNGRLLRLYKTKDLAGNLIQFSANSDSREPLTRTKLEIVDKFGNKLADYPESSILSDLYRAASEQAADVKGLIDDILND